jgi:hydrogenase nickel incorporation protein HypB
MRMQGGKEEKEVEAIEVESSVGAANKRIARRNRARLDSGKILCVNLMGSPGSGKTTFIEGLAMHIPPSEMAVIQGDLESDVDRVRLEGKGVAGYQINTHGGCHLNAAMIWKALRRLDLGGKKYLIVENVGNLVCPAGIPLGQHVNVVVTSTAEGWDKPRKYPHIFLDADLVAISKYDLKGAVDFAERKYLKDLKGINPRLKLARTSKKRPASFKEPASHLQAKRKALFGK